MTTERGNTEYGRDSRDTLAHFPHFFARPQTYASWSPDFSDILSLALFLVPRNNADMPPDLIALFLMAGASCAVTMATVMCVGFPRPETRFTLVVTLLLVYAPLTLAPLVFLPYSPSP